MNDDMTKLTENRNKKNAVNIIGSCIPRDALSLHSDEGVVVKKFVQSINPISAVGNSPLNKELIGDISEIMVGVSPFYQRNICLDLEKSVFRWAFDSDAEWLIIDAGAFRNEIILYGNQLYATKILDGPLQPAFP